ncbi:hypothetical protein G4Y79_10365 [Phototrophicus methaneseepsis]|uniref:Uncharacterized protein n=1 Tax=Phototrophicus methaneseepsis TaxID=2710758 RepID=A0A7S8ED30_9CHLR|nr:hypothetical protein [Phototrophicus methaneseepsis]QPC84755.1 hypothetical protein G4Y79_10365 [Phototrophicus methaneseepsis]
MSQPTHPEEKDPLRSLFDNAYRMIYGKHSINNTVHVAFDNTHVRRTGRTIVFVGIAILAIVLYFTFDLIGQQIVAMNKPTAEDLLVAPYNLSGQTIETMSFAEGSATLALLQNEGYTYISNSVNLPLITCVGSTLATGEANAVSEVCPVAALASNAEVALFSDPDKHSLAIAVASFDDANNAYTTLTQLFQYARTLGRSGNFVFSRSDDVQYFFSEYNNTLQFAWLKDNTLYLLAGADNNPVSHFIDIILPDNA